MFFIVYALDNLEYFLLVFKVVGVLVAVSYSKGQAFTESASLLHKQHLGWRSFSVRGGVSVLSMEDLRHFMVANPLSIYAIYLENDAFTFKEFAFFFFLQKIHMNILH